MKRLFYLFVSLVAVVGLCVCTSCKKTEKVEKKQEVTKMEEVQKGNVTTPAPEVTTAPEATVEEANKTKEVVSEEKTSAVKAAPEEVTKTKGAKNAKEGDVTEAASEEKTTVKQAASVDLAAGKEVYEKKGMCMACHGADGSKPFKLTKLFTGKDYTVEEQEEWIEKEPQMKMLKNKLTKQDLINVTGYLNQKLKK